MKNSIAIFLLIAIAILARLFFADIPAIIVPDSSGYTNMAKSFSHDNPLAINSIRTIGYPYFLHNIFNLFKSESLLNVVFIQKILSVLSGMIIYSICWLRTKNVGISFLGGLSFFLNGHYISYDHLILPHALHTFLMALALLGYAIFLMKKHYTTLFFSGVFVFLQAIVRPSGKLWIFAFLPGFFLKERKKHAIISTIIIFATFYALMGAWNMLRASYGGKHAGLVHMQSIVINSIIIRNNYVYLSYPLSKTIKEKIALTLDENENPIPNDSKEAFQRLMKIQKNYQGDEKNKVIGNLLYEIALHNIFQQPFYVIFNEILNNGYENIMSPPGICDPPGAVKTHPFYERFGFEGSDSIFFQKRISELFHEGSYRVLLQKIWVFWGAPFGIPLVVMIITLVISGFFFKDQFLISLMLSFLNFFLITSILIKGHEKYRIEWEWMVVMGFVLSLHHIYGKIKSVKT